MPAPGSRVCRQAASTVAAQAEAEATRPPSSPAASATETTGPGRRRAILSPPQVGRLLGHSALKQGDLVQVHHGDVPDDVRQALVQQGEDDDVQRGPLGLETEPEEGVRGLPAPRGLCAPT